MEFPEVTIVINDLSDDETKKKSALQLEKLNLLDFSEKNKATGVIYLIDEVTHKEITNIEVSKTTDEIVNELTKKIKSH